MKKILVFMADGCEEIEALTVVDVLRRAQMHVDMASVSGAEIVNGSHGIRILSDILVEDAKLDEYDGVVLPGGAPGYKNLAASDLVKKLTTKACEEGKLVAAICASPTVLGAFGLLDGKAACCYPGMEDGLIGANVNTDIVTVDNNIITSRGMGTTIEFALTIVEYFTDAKTARDLGETFVWNRP